MTAESIPKPLFGYNNEDFEDEYYGEEDDDEEREKVKADPNQPKIIRPDVDIEMPDFIAKAEELLEAEQEAERERIRILNITPVNFMFGREALRKEKAKKRRQMKKQYYYNMPAWVLNPLNEVDYEEEALKLQLLRQAEIDLLEA